MKPPPLLLDFETRSPLDVRDVGAYRYTTDPRTSILCCAAKQGTGHDVFFDMVTGVPFWVLDALDDPDVLIHAHNAAFERLVIQNIAGPRYGWPVPALSRFRCSAARARRLAYPGALDKAGAALGLSIVKDKEGTNIMRRLTKPIKRGPDGFVYDNTPAKLVRLGEYCLQDVFAEEAIEEATLPIPAREQAYWEMTERMNDRGIRVDQQLVKRLVWRAAEAMHDLNARLDEITDGAVTALTQVPRLKAWIKAETGRDVPSLGKELMDELVIHADFPPHVQEALRIRQEGAKSSVSKLVTILDRLSDDGRLRGAFVYHGASTGRYTSMGVQLQNLVRDTHKDFDNDIQRLDEFTLPEISKSIRQTFIPDPGNVFIDADYNAIEARGVGWLMGAKRLLRIYRNGGDPYCEMGTVIYGFPVTKANETERFVGKQTILGCGYGMGAAKFFAQCERFGTPVEMSVAQSAIDAYRSEFHEIKSGWYEIEDAAIEAVQNTGAVVSCLHGKIQFCVRKGYLQMMLPSGRPLFYRAPRIDMVDKWDNGRKSPVLTYMAQHPITKQWTRESTWGGKLTENAVQGICRDLLFEATERLETDHGILAAMSVHDQGVFEVSKADAEWARDTVKHEMERVPYWAEGFPIMAEPKITTRFGK